MGGDPSPCSLIKFLNCKFQAIGETDHRMGMYPRAERFLMQIVAGRLFSVKRYRLF